MKTFDEALSCCTISVEYPSQQEAEAAIAGHIARINSYKDRYLSLAADVNASDQFGRMVVDLMNQQRQGILSIPDLIMSAFMCGLITGSEMQKSDVGVEAL